MLATKRRPVRKSRKTAKKRDVAIEVLYENFFRANPAISEQDEHSLEQPSPLKFVESITTYGVYETPVR